MRTRWRTGTGVQGALGDGQGKWALTVEANRPIHAMSLSSNPTGHLTNLSSTPPGRNTFVPLFPAAGESVLGVVRIINHSDQAGEVRIVATDDAGGAPSTGLAVHRGRARRFTSTPATWNAATPRRASPAAPAPVRATGAYSSPAMWRSKGSRISSPMTDS